MKKLNYTEDLLRVIFFWIGIFFLVSGVLSFLGILKPAVNSGIQNPDMLGTVFSITGVLLCIISAALGIYTASNIGRIAGRSCKKRTDRRQYCIPGSFDTRLMNCLMPRPGQVQKEFWDKYKESPKEATDYFIN